MLKKSSARNDQLLIEREKVKIQLGLKYSLSDECCLQQAKMIVEAQEKKENDRLAKLIAFECEVEAYNLNTIAERKAQIEKAQKEYEEHETGCMTQCKKHLERQREAYEKEMKAIEDQRLAKEFEVEKANI